MLFFPSSPQVCNYLKQRWPTWPDLEDVTNCIREQKVNNIQDST